MRFEGALAALREGRKVTRAGWNGRGMWVALSPGFMLEPEQIYSRPVREFAEQSYSGVGIFRPYLMMRTVEADFVPWVASHSDILAEDWETVP